MRLNDMRDLRYALRVLFKAKGFFAVAILTLAIGVGANTAIFSVIDTVLLRPLPFRDPDRLVRLFETEAAPGKYPLTAQDVADWRAQNHTFQDMTIYGWLHDMNASRNGEAVHILGTPTAANFFDVFGVAPMLGRTWTRDEGQPGKSPVVVLSYGFWQSRFAGDPHILNQTIELDSRKYTIVGVMPPKFRYPTRAQLWYPDDLYHQFSRASHWATGVGRLKPGISIKTAQADLVVIAAALEKAHPETNYKVRAVVTSLRDNLIGDSRASLLMMLWAVSLVLLIACANVANLLLSRAVARRKEIAVRSALGAGRARLMRQWLTESIVLGLAGGAAGLLLGWGVVFAFSRAKSFALPQFNTLELNGAVLAFTFGLALLTGILFGLFPAVQLSRPDLLDELKGGAGSSVSPSRARRFASNSLVVSEIALSLLLLVGAGLLLKDFARLRSTDIGVRPDGVWTAAVRLPEAHYEKLPQQEEFARSLIEKARNIPGVDAAALTDHLPLEGGSNGYIDVRGRPTGPMSGPLVESHQVSPEYFRALGIRLISGRIFGAEDMERTAAYRRTLEEADKHHDKVSAAETNAMTIPAVINQAMVRTFWPNENPLGQLFSRSGPDGPWYQVIGVVNDVNQWGLTQHAISEAYTSFSGDDRFFLVLHSSSGIAGITETARRSVAELDSSLPLFNVRTMDQVIGESAQGSQFLTLLVGCFAVFAALLAAVGIYGVLSYAVNQRTREIGIRISLGAGKGQVLGQVLAEGMKLAALGFAIGIAGALAAGRLMSTLLHGVHPNDIAVLVGTTALLAGIALAACYIPARRAARLDPMSALRHE